MLHQLEIHSMWPFVTEATSLPILDSRRTEFCLPLGKHVWQEIISRKTINITTCSSARCVEQSNFNVLNSDVILLHVQLSPYCKSTCQWIQRSLLWKIKIEILKKFILSSFLILSHTYSSHLLLVGLIASLVQKVTKIAKCGLPRCRQRLRISNLLEEYKFTLIIKICLAPSASFSCLQ